MLSRTVRPFLHRLIPAFLNYVQSIEFAMVALQSRSRKILKIINRNIIAKSHIIMSVWLLCHIGNGLMRGKLKILALGCSSASAPFRKTKSEDRDGLEINDFLADKAMQFSYLLCLSTIITEGLDAINTPSIPAGWKRKSWQASKEKCVGIMQRQLTKVCIVSRNVLRLTRSVLNSKQFFHCKHKATTRYCFLLC